MGPQGSVPSQGTREKGQPCPL